MTTLAESTIYLHVISRVFQTIFALGADEFLAMLEGKISEGPFLKVQSGKTTVCFGYFEKFQI